MSSPSSPTMEARRHRYSRPNDPYDERDEEHAAYEYYKYWEARRTYDEYIRRLERYNEELIGVEMQIMNMMMNMMILVVVIDHQQHNEYRMRNHVHHQVFNNNDISSTSMQQPSNSLDVPRFSRVRDSLSRHSSTSQPSTSGQHGGGSIYYAESLNSPEDEYEYEDEDEEDEVRTPTPARASVEPRSSSSRSDDLRSRIKDIESKFFTDDLSDSSVSSFLKKYVEGNIPLPATKELDKPETQDLPVFGVSGCGKTRSVIEVLYLQWGFYFNASQTDLGSRDLSELADYIGKRTLKYNSTSIPLRLIILEHCLGVPNCHETFSSANWALLQVCPNTFRDVFWELFQKLYKEIKVYGTDEAELIPIICDKFESVHKMLIKLDYPNFSSKSKFRLVIDEAQLLADMKSKSFNSSSSSGIRRPILKDSDTDSKSGRDRNSGSDRNGNGDDSSNSSPHIQFSEWKGVGSVQALEAKIAEYLNYFTGRLTIKEAFGLFLSHYYRLGDPSLVLENDGAWLVEIGFGHIKFFNGVARTVLDEPFVLKATENYFQNQPVSSSPFSNAFPDLPDENVTIVGYDGQGLRLGASHKYFTMHQFMKAHVENGSKQDDESMPPFYFPAPHVTGPDIIFFVKIKNNIYPCFVQLKLRQKFEKDDAMTALETVSSVTVQKKMKTEHDKQQKSTTSASSDQQQPQLKDYCPDEKYISMVIVYPAKVTDDNFCGVQVDSDPGSDGLKRVSIKIDGSNFSDIFPEDHVKFLNILKKCSENQPSKKPKEKNKFFHLFSKARQTVNFQQLRHE
ncbi:hypothetical protein BDF22DRAFT_654729 [Syncephalis plumigaleata]|nr:hypothetical protein BDF22DRAFT_654729 [Syncephalis plumigaleata]